MALLMLSMLAFALLVGCAEERTTISTRETQVAKPAKVLRHVVLFKFKDAATPEQINAVVEAFKALPSKIEVVKGFEWGTNVSPEQHSQGLTHAFFLTFSSAADRDSYLVHPAHKDFGKLVGPVLDKVTVVDYWAQ
jgi:hypothetical protein